MRYRSTPTAALLAALSALLASCGQGTIVAPNVRLVGGVPNVDVKIGKDTLTYPLAGHQDLLQLARGTIAVNDQGAGFLRSVQSVETQGDQVVVHTAPATLADALVSGHFHDQLPLQPQTMSFGPHENLALTLGASGVSVMATSGATVAVPQATFSFAPSLDFGIDVEGGQLQDFHAIASGQIDASVDLHAQLLDPGKKVTLSSPPVTLATLPPAYFDVQIGPVPVVLVVQPSLRVVAKVSFHDSLTMDVTGTLHGQFSAGAAYDDVTGWSPVGDQSVLLTGTGPTFSNAAKDIDVRLYLQGALSVTVYGLVGPTLAVGPYAGAGATLDPKQPCIEDGHGEVGVAGTFGVSAGLFGFGIPLYSATLFDSGQQFGDFTLPLPAGSCPSCASLTDGTYCGGDGVSGDSGSLYTCSGGTIASTTPCGGTGCALGATAGSDACGYAGPSCRGLTDGDYCGGDGVDGDLATLYSCRGEALVATTPCALGCSVQPPGTYDFCVAASCVGLGDGDYCGNDQVNGDPGTLYHCSGGLITGTQPCAGACARQPAPIDDTCSSLSCAGVPDGDYCGSDVVDGDAGTLYHCAGGVVTGSTVCATACAVEPRSITSDFCY